ncbi:hypothetical protein H4K35_07950 [Myroides sp. NP-2]|uniref:hypothetical protein n=1 Tax=Myroides sp. NP-2 TaxID=2759945 RepID=UPI0015FA8CE4|nr:hypothetical protein [Myroides sp. NP-2]MBB1150063.1 hypothetical protein [Myroides sp. NP-2]
MKRIFYLICLSTLGLWSSATVAQSKEKLNPSAVATATFNLADLNQHNYSYVIEIQNQVYSGYSSLGLNPKMIKDITLEKGAFAMDGFTYDRKIKMETKDAKQLQLLTLQEWSKDAGLVDSHVVFLLNQTVLNVKPEYVLIDKNFILDSEVVVLDQLGFEKPVTVVKLRTKTKENFKSGAKISSR